MGSFTPEEGTLDINWIRGWVGPELVWMQWQKRFLAPARN
jgi:hypothetical protein